MKGVRNSQSSEQTVPESSYNLLMESRQFALVSTNRDRKLLWQVQNAIGSALKITKRDRKLLWRAQTVIGNCFEEHNLKDSTQFAKAVTKAKATSLRAAPEKKV